MTSYNNYTTSTDRQTDRYLLMTCVYHIYMTTCVVQLYSLVIRSDRQLLKFSSGNVYDLDAEGGVVLGGLPPCGPQK